MPVSFRSEEGEIAIAVRDVLSLLGRKSIGEIERWAEESSESGVSSGCFACFCFGGLGNAYWC